MDRSITQAQLDRSLLSTDFKGLGTRYQGKVRDTYDDGDRLILITTDRISAFDHVLRQSIPFKGQVLNQLAAYFFEHSADIIPNHVLQVPDPNVTIAARCEPMPIEFVVRGYLVGHAWRVYRDGGRLLCGVRLPEGLVENVAFPGPILTPTTKAAEGHDEDISAADIVDRGILDSETFEYLRAMSLALFRRGSEMAEAQGLILVDTKYEFGRRADGTLVVIDEIHTPDSSRYFYADGYEERLAAGQPPRQLSKEFVREWLMEHGFMGREGQHLPDLPDDFRVNVSERYVELFESVTGSEFVPDTNPAPQERILTALGSTIVR